MGGLGFAGSLGLAEGLGLTGELVVLSYREDFNVLFFNNPSVTVNYALSTEYKQFVRLSL